MTTMQIIEFNINRHLVLTYGTTDERMLAHVYTLMFDHHDIQPFSAYAAMFDLCLSLVKRLNQPAS